MPDSRVTQDQINKAAWAVCDTFRGTVDPSVYKDYVLTMLFVKYISDVWMDHLDNLELTAKLLKHDPIQPFLALQ